MTLSWRARRRWSLIVLLVGLPLYVIAAVNAVGWFDRPGILVELAIYVGLGIAWMLPLRAVFLGVGRADPDAASDPDTPADATASRSGPARTLPTERLDG